MSNKNGKKETDNAIGAITKEMMKPRITKSARIAELNLDTARIPKKPSATMSGTIDRIVQSPRLRQPEKARIAIDETDLRYRNFRIENALTDEYGDNVKLPDKPKTSSKKRPMVIVRQK
jgi:hypothetical protein